MSSHIFSDEIAKKKKFCDHIYCGSWEWIPIQKYSKENVLLVTIAGNVSAECVFFSPGFCGFSTQQECIPVGCIPPTCCPYLPACNAVEGGVPGPGGVPAQGGGVPGPGQYLPGGVPGPGGGCVPSPRGGGVPAWGGVPGGGCTWSREVYLVWGCT